MEFEGIVIRSTPFRDNDSMVTVLSKDKIHSFLARGVLKYESKLGYAVNNYTKTRFVIAKGKEGYSLRSAELLDSFENIKTNIESLAVEDFLLEITNKLVQNEDASKVYPFLEKSLVLLNKGFDVWTVAIVYFAKLLDISGFSLNVDSCQICGKKDHIVTMSYLDGGFICQDCFSSLKHSKMTSLRLKVFRYIFKVDIDNFGKIEFPREECIFILNELDKFLSHICQLHLKSLDLIKKL